MRSLLTMLGIIIGIASVEMVVALGRGSQEKFWPTSIRWAPTPSAFIRAKVLATGAPVIKTLTVGDANVIGRQGYVESATPLTSSNGTLTYRNTDLSAQLYGAGAQYF